MGSGLCHLARATRPAKNGIGDRGTAIGDRKDKLFRSPVTVDRSLNEAKLAFSVRPSAAGNQKKNVFRSPITGSRSLSRALATRAIKSNERLVPVSFTRCRASTSGLSTWWSSTALQGELVLRLVSRLDAFSGYPFRI